MSELELETVRSLFLGALTLPRRMGILAHVGPLGGHVQVPHQPSPPRTSPGLLLGKGQA